MVPEMVESEHWDLKWYDFQNKLAQKGPVIGQYGFL